MLGIFVEYFTQIWVSILNWLTLIILFILFNVVIETIVVTSTMFQNTNTNKDI